MSEVRKPKVRSYIDVPIETEATVYFEDYADEIVAWINTQPEVAKRVSLTTAQAEDDCARIVAELHELKTDDPGMFDTVYRDRIREAL